MALPYNGRRCDGDLAGQEIAQDWSIHDGRDTGALNSGRGMRAGIVTESQSHTSLQVDKTGIIYNIIYYINIMEIF